jgi:hypothetical protein
MAMERGQARLSQHLQPQYGHGTMTQCWTSGAHPTRPQHASDGAIEHLVAGQWEQQGSR